MLLLLVLILSVPKITSEIFLGNIFAIEIWEYTVNTALRQGASRSNYFRQTLNSQIWL